MVNHELLDDLAKDVARAAWRAAANELHRAAIELIDYDETK
jgi:hypothetical protein